jgi:hypothetical protein
LFVARLISGFSAGLATATATATLVDLAGAKPVWSRVVPGALTLLGLATALSVAGEGERGRVSSLFYLITYVGPTIPVIGAGLGVAEASILATFIVVSAVLAAFDLAALSYLRRRDRLEAGAVEAGAVEAGA